MELLSNEEHFYTGYVYDLSTSAGTFMAYPNIVVKNTDSVYVMWNSRDMQDAFRISEEAANVVTESFPSPIQLEFEKVMCPLALYSKKRYTFQMWERPDSPNPVIHHVGTQVVRRDTCKYVQNAMQTITTLLIQQQDKEAALQHSRHVVSNLLTGNVRCEELTLTRNIKDSYKNENLPHIRLANRLKNRNDVNQVRAGDRIRFLFVDSDKELETPDYIRDHEIQVDYMKYFEKQLKTPLDSLWGLMMDAENVYADILEQSRRSEKKRKDVQGFLRLFHRSSN
jgi:DNA polymerase delta subunit 1